LRIAIVAACPLPWPRGTPIRVHRIAEALVGRGHDVNVVTYALGDARVPLAYGVHRVGRVYAHDDGRPGPSLRKALQLDPLLVRGLVRLLRASVFDVIHAHHYEGLLAALCAGRFVAAPPVVFDAHTLLATELPHYRLGLPRGLTGRIGRALDRHLPPRADHVIAVSDDMRAALLADGRLSSERVSLIPNGIEAEHFAGSVGGDERSAIPGRIVFAGNLARYQGIDLLLRAFALVLAVRPEVRLLLLTDTPFDDYRSLAGQLRIANAVSVEPVDYATLPERLRTGDVLVNPRVACSGIPQKLLNYMASGRPIVSFAGSAKLLEHERTALLVTDGDVDAFAHSVCRLLDARGLGQLLAGNARRLVLAEHSWSQVAARVEVVYRHLVPDRLPEVAERGR
jgi:glycosyltransferase involved in cell wall biosynthesis